MPLDPLKLASALTDLFQGKPAFPADPAKAGEQWAEIYRKYASEAVAGTTAPVGAVLNTAATALAKALAAAFIAATVAGPAGAAAFLPLLDAAFRAFWGTPIPFAFPPLPAPPTITGVVTVPASGSLAGQMSTALAAGLLPGAAASLQGTAIASALHAWSKTISVTNTAAPAPPQSPVNLT
jgi:hypothetical protein